MSREIVDPGLVEELKGRGFGEEEEDGRLVLSLIEEVFLVEKGSLDGDFCKVFEEASCLDEGFESRFLVYRDLMSRGFYLRPGGSVADFLVYGRGVKPGEGGSKYLVNVFYERETFSFDKLFEWVEKAYNLKKQLVLSIVDGEGDVTHYSVSETDLKGDVGFGGFSGKGFLLNDRIITGEERFYREEFFGRLLSDVVLLSLIEGIFLAEQGRLDLEVSIDSLKEMAAEGEEIFTEKLRVYRFLRERGVVPKTGFKFGSHFRTYSSFSSPDKFPHAENVLNVVLPGYVFNPSRLSRAVRLAQSVGKTMVYGCVAGDVRFLGFRRLKL